MIILLCILLFCLILSSKETFIRDIPILRQTIPYIFPNNVIPILNLPVPTPLRSTRNMSYDIRGDPIIIQPEQYVWNNPGVLPKFNRDMYYNNRLCKT